ncbi:MAG: NAD(P)H-dependent oxidoreductase [Candidatus Aminicenantes bacterium]|nr:NAD(P)H-dependent oxidoreductase [Candidatus Aminicenantes bacterium]
MNALILNGSLKHQYHLDPIQNILMEELENAGWNPKSILLHQANIRGCLGCFKCWDTTPGLCIQQKDEAPGIVKQFLQSELIVFLTPLTFGGYSSELKQIIERMLGILQPGVTVRTGETHHLKRYERYPSLFALGVTETVDVEEERLFKALIERHSHNFYPPKYRTDVIHSGDEDRRIRGRVKKNIGELELNS